MSSVQARRSAVHEVLFNRPYLRSDLIRIAAFLCEEGYSTVARNRVIDAVADGTPLRTLVERQELEPADLERAEHYLAIGQQINARRPRQSVRSIADLAGLLLTALRSAGLEPELHAAALAVRVDGRPVQIALIPAVSGGSVEAISPVPPELTEEEEMALIDAWDQQASEEYGHYLDSLTDEQIDALAAEAALAVEGDGWRVEGEDGADGSDEICPPPSTLHHPPISGGAPLRDADGSIADDAQARAWEAMAARSREWYRRNPTRPDID